MTTGSTSNVSATGATLSASFEGATGTIYETGFLSGKSEGSLEELEALKGDGTNNASGTFSATLGSLDPETTYWYKAYIREWNESTSEWEYRYGSARSFTTTRRTSADMPSWLEMPAWTSAGMSGTTTSSLDDLYPLVHKVGSGASSQRNYSCLYDPEMYASYWVAYPLCAAHLGSGYSTSWAYDPAVPSGKQTNLTAGAYGVSVKTENYPNNLYSRGHQIPNADRSGVSDMNAQTFYMTNLTPQLQYGFNSPVWSDLETAVRDLTSSTDSVYVVTGAAFRKKGGTESVTTITNSRDGKKIPVPNYYWKVLLKVKWSGSDASKTVSSASTIGVWMPHADLKGQSYTSYVVSVDQIEAWTGFDLFTNLPGDNSSGIEKTAEANTSWTDFQSF